MSSRLRKAGLPKPSDFGNVLLGGEVLYVSQKTFGREIRWFWHQHQTGCGNFTAGSVSRWPNRRTKSGARCEIQLEAIGESTDTAFADSLYWATLSSWRQTTSGCALA